MTRYILTSTLRHGGELPECYKVNYMGNQPDKEPKYFDFDIVQLSNNHLGIDAPAKVTVGFQTLVQLEGSPLDTEDVPHGEVIVRTRSEIVSISMNMKKSQRNKIELKYNNKYVKKNDVIFDMHVESEIMNVNMYNCQITEGADDWCQAECETWNNTIY